MAACEFCGYDNTDNAINLGMLIAAACMAFGMCIGAGVMWAALV